MEKEKLLELIHCKLKDKDAVFKNLAKDVGLVYFVDLFGVLSVSSKVLYHRTTIIERIVAFPEIHFKVPYKTEFSLELNYYGYEKLNFELTIDEFNEINSLICDRLNLADKEKIERLEKEITKELENCK